MNRLLQLENTMAKEAPENEPYTAVQIPASQLRDGDTYSIVPPDDFRKYR
jgi:hypothetical protein